MIDADLHVAALDQRLRGGARLRCVARISPVGNNVIAWHLDISASHRLLHPRHVVDFALRVEQA